MKLGEYIKNFRKRRGLSQRQFASLCGVSNGYISMLEEGKNPRTNEPIVPSLQTLKKICSVIGISIHELFSIVDDMPISMKDYKLQEADPIIDMNFTSCGKVAKNIRLYREKLNLTHKQLADKLGISETTIFDWENEKSPITAEQLLSICIVLDVTVRQMFDIVEPQVIGVAELMSRELKSYIVTLLFEYIKKYQKQKNITMEQFADLCNVSANYLTILEREKTFEINDVLGISPEVIYRIVSVIGISYKGLIEEARIICNRDKLKLSIDSSDVVFTDHEKAVILAYRKNPDMQGAVDRLLGVEREGADIAEDMIKTVRAGASAKKPTDTK